MSMIKGPGQDRAIASAVELGASHVWLFSSSRSNVRLDKKRMQNKVAHWHKTVVAAAEINGRGRGSRGLAPSRYCLRAEAARCGVDCCVD